MPCGHSKRAGTARRDTPELMQRDPQDGPYADRRTLLGDGREVGHAELAELVYDDLRGVAAAFFRDESQQRTLQPTALVHEAYLRLADQGGNFDDRSHFFRVAARAMRRVLIDAARTRGAQKRGGELNRVTLIEGVDQAESQTFDVLEFEEALGQLGELKQRYVDIVELRFFGGLSFPEIAKTLQLSESQVFKDWNMARSHLVLYFRDRESEN